MFLAADFQVIKIGVRGGGGKKKVKTFKRLTLSYSHTHAVMLPFQLVVALSIFVTWHFVPLLLDLKKEVIVSIFKL